MTGYVSLDAYEQFCENYENYGIAGVDYHPINIPFVPTKVVDMYNHPAREGLHTKGIKHVAMNIFDNAKELVAENPALATAVAATAVAGGATAGILGHRAKKKKKKKAFNSPSFSEDFLDYSKLSRTYFNKHLNTADAPNYHLSEDRHNNLRIAEKARGKLAGTAREVDLPIHVGDMGKYSGTNYNITEKQMDKLKMKRDPEYRAKRLAEISDRKQKGRFNSDVSNLVNRLRKTIK